MRQNRARYECVGERTRRRENSCEQGQDEIYVQCAEKGTSLLPKKEEEEMRSRAKSKAVEEDAKEKVLETSSQLDGSSSILSSFPFLFLEKKRKCRIADQKGDNNMPAKQKYRRSSKRHA